MHLIDILSSDDDTNPLVKLERAHDAIAEAAKEHPPLAKAAYEAARAFADIRFIINAERCHELVREVLRGK